MRAGIVSVALLGWVGGQSLAQDPTPIEKPTHTFGPAERVNVYLDCEQPRSWLAGDWLLWWTKTGPLPPLVTTSPVAGAAGGGTLADPLATVVSGGESRYGRADGLRLLAGYWLSCNRAVGLELGGFFLERRSDFFSARADAAGAPLLAFPYFDALNNVEARLLVADPGNLAGAGHVDTQGRLWGLDAHLLIGLPGGCFSWYGLVGARTLAWDESLFINGQSTVLADGAGTFLNVGLNAGDRYGFSDRFAVRNRFYGPQLGGKWTWASCGVQLDMTGKVAFGVTRRTVETAGFSSASVGGADPVVVAGGLFAQATNSGTRSETEFSVVPEVGVNLGIDLWSGATLSVGYTLIYWTKVARVGRQVDRVIDPRQVPLAADFAAGAAVASPAGRNLTSDFWAQGVNLQLFLRF